MLPGHFSGFLRVRLTARTPLLIGGFGTPEKPDLPRRAADGKVIVPGSGLMGAVRSLHETLAGGCLRVLDTDWVPVHRHPASIAYTSDLKLAVVSRVKDGRATEVVLCDRWIWVPADLLPAAPGELPRTGDHLQYQPQPGRASAIPEKALSGQGSRRVLHARSDRYPDGVPAGSLVTVGPLGPVRQDCWVLLVTDTRARDGKRPVHFACGKTGPDGASYRVPDAAWDTYQAVVAGADDLRPEELRKAGATTRDEPPFDPDKPGYARVFPPPGAERRGEPEPLGERLRARSYLYAGQPVWVRADERDRVVTEIRLSQFWRYAGSPGVGDRVGDAAPCARHDSLCWSCRIFGSADTRGRDADDLAVQDSYRGHVRIDDLIADGDVERLEWHLAPLASPKPGAGQFYLDNSKNSQRPARKDTPAAATWGSVADQPAPRPIRGRKYYWRTREPASGDFPRGRYRDHQSEAMSGRAHLIPAGTTFHGRVAFDNLSLADLGSLLAALDPRTLANAGDGRDWSGTVTSVGGGKPFGLGAVTIDVEALDAQEASARYLGSPGGQVDQAGAVRAFRDGVPAGVASAWPALCHALTFGFVPDEKVWYPPGSGTKGSQDYDKSFEFFARTNGLSFAAQDRMLVALPDPAGSPADQELPSEGRIRERERDGR